MENKKPCESAEPKITIDFTIKGLHPCRPYVDTSRIRVERHIKIQNEIIRLFQELRLPPSSMEAVLQDIRDYVIRNEKILVDIHNEKYPPYST